MPPLRDLTGRIFGDLIVISRGQTVNRRVRWTCVCSCGATLDVRADHLLGGGAASCGCENVRKFIERTRGNKIAEVHGHFAAVKNTPTHNSYQSMKRRCLNPRHKNYPWYGGRGVTICDRWLGDDGFSHFLEDMGERPDGMTLDRVDPDGHYEPANCRWATRSEQAATRRSRTVGVTRIPAHPAP